MDSLTKDSFIKDSKELHCKNYWRGYLKEKEVQSSNMLYDFYTISYVV